MTTLEIDNEIIGRGEAQHSLAWIVLSERLHSAK
jgi:hypothetical protein